MEEENKTDECDECETVENENECNDPEECCECCEEDISVEIIRVKNGYIILADGGSLIASGIDEAMDIAKEMLN